MKKLQQNFGSSLFLMEMILALLFLSLSCATCIQIFAAARSNRIRAEQLNQIQTLTTSVGEALEGTDGSADEILELIPDGVQEDPEINWYYDNAWKIIPRKVILPHGDLQRTETQPDAAFRCAGCRSQRGRGYPLYPEYVFSGSAGTDTDLHW